MKAAGEVVPQALPPALTCFGDSGHRVTSSRLQNSSMLVLFDHERREEYPVSKTRGQERLANGALLKAAEEAFDLLLTTDDTFLIR
jgi:hypothetical protein